MRLVGLVHVVVKACQKGGLCVIGPEDEETGAGFGEVLVDGGTRGGLEAFEGRGECEEGEGDVEGEGEDDGLLVRKGG